MNGMLAGYAVSVAGYLGAAISGKKLWGRIATAALLAALAANAAVIIMRWVSAGRAPLGSLYDVLLVLAAAVVLFSVVAAWRHRLAFAGLFAGLAALTLLGYASTLDATIRPLVPALRSNILAFHVGAYLAGYAACAVAFGASAARLCILRLPGGTQHAEALDRFTAGCILFAFPFLTVGMSLGMVWAESAWGRYWGWDPKESWSLIAWLIYAHYVQLKLSGNLGGRNRVWLPIAGFGAILFTLFGVNLLFDGLHSYR